MSKLFHTYTTHNKLKKHEKVCNNHDYCQIDTPKEHEKIKYLPEEKSLKALLKKCLLKKKMQHCQNNPENSYTDKKANHKLY